MSKKLVAVLVAVIVVAPLFGCSGTPKAKPCSFASGFDKDPCGNAVEINRTGRF